MATVVVLAFPIATLASEVVNGVANQPGAARGSAPPPPAPSGVANPYAGISNEQLADVADRWQALDQDQRRWFFVEVRKRLMAADGAPTIPIGPNARFGQVVRNRDGTVARIEPQVSAQPAGTADSRRDPRAYGLGFERRLEVQAGAEGRSGPTRGSVRLPPAGQPPPGKPDGGT